MISCERGVTNPQFRLTETRSSSSSDTSTLPFFCAHFITAEPLAYITAKTNGLDELASEILESAGLTEDDVEDRELL
jgi:hypothetical protein